MMTGVSHDNLACVDGLTGSDGRLPLASLSCLGLSQENVSLICLHIAASPSHGKSAPNTDPVKRHHACRCVLPCLRAAAFLVSGSLRIACILRRRASSISGRRAELNGRCGATGCSGVSMCISRLLLRMANSSSAFRFCPDSGV